jgi:hypothetical protein
MTEERGPKGMHGEHRGHGPMGERGAHDGMGHGPKNQLGELDYEGKATAPTDGSTVDGIAPSPSTTP